MFEPLKALAVPGQCRISSGKWVRTRTGLPVRAASLKQQATPRRMCLPANEVRRKSDTLNCFGAKAGRPQAKSSGRQSSSAACFKRSNDRAERSEERPLRRRAGGAPCSNLQNAAKASRALSASSHFATGSGRRACKQRHSGRAGDEVAKARFLLFFLQKA